MYNYVYIMQKYTLLYNSYIHPYVNYYIGIWINIDILTNIMPALAEYMLGIMALPIKQNTTTQWWFNAGSPSTTLSHN